METKKLPNVSTEKATEMAKGDLKGNISAKGKGFDGNPQNIYRQGQRKSFSIINEQLKEQGVEALTKSQFIEAYTLIFNATEDELKEIASDKQVPMVLRLIITEISNKTTRSKALADYRDYMFGRAEQRTDLTTGGKPLESNYDLSKLSTKALQELLKAHISPKEEQEEEVLKPKPKPIRK